MRKFNQFIRTFSSQFFKENIAIIGGGLFANGFLDRLHKLLQNGGASKIKSITIFDNYGKYGMGAGMPYDRQTTDIEHRAHVSSKYLSVGFKGFDKWLVENQNEIRAEFAKIIDERLQEKFIKRFGVSYDRNSTLSEEQKKLVNHYNSIRNSIEKRYLNLEVATACHPRVLIGMFNIIQLRKVVEEIKSHGVEVILRPQTEVDSITKLDPDIHNKARAMLSFGGEKSFFYHVIVATGKWRADSKTSFDGKLIPYIKDVWPIDNFQQKLNEILDRENSDNKSPKKIAIQGNGLSAIDATKTIFNNGYFEETENGDLVFVPNKQEVGIEVTLLSRNGIVPQVSGKENWHQQKKFRGGYPLGTEITLNAIKAIAEKQDGKVRLWQIMLMMARALENAYNIEGETEMAKEAAEFVQLIINNVAKTTSSDHAVNYDNSDIEEGPTLSQLYQIQEKFSLQLDGANYREIFNAFQEKFLNRGQTEQLYYNLQKAETGDVASGYQLWKSIFNQIEFMADINEYLIPEEAAYYSHTLDRIFNAFIRGMPIYTAKELVALNKAGFLKIEAIGNDAKELCEENGKMVFELGNGEKKIYDAVVSARGYDDDITKNPSKLFKSMLDQGYLTKRKFLWAETIEEFNAKKIDLEKRFGVEESAKTLSKVRRDGDNWYYIPGGILKKEFKIVDEKGNDVLPGVIFPDSFGIIMTKEHGKTLCNRLLKEKEIDVESVNDPSLSVISPNAESILDSQEKQI